jgi:hypothetical protein
MIALSGTLFIYLTVQCTVACQNNLGCRHFSCNCKFSFKDMPCIMCSLIPRFHGHNNT